MKSTSRNEQKEEVKLKHFRQWASRLKCICILITGFIQTFGIVAVCTPVLFSQINMFIIWLYKTNQPNDFYRLQNEGNLDVRFSKSVHIWNTQHSWFETLNKFWNENINICYLLRFCEWFRSLPCANTPYQQLCIVAVMQLVKRIKRKWKHETRKICIIIII